MTLKEFANTVNLSAIELPSIRRYSIVKPLSFCKQPRDEQEGHSRNGPLLPARIWTCHIRTVEVPVVQFHYAASRGLSLRSAAQLLWTLLDSFCCVNGIRSSGSSAVPDGHTGIFYIPPGSLHPLHGP